MSSKLQLSSCKILPIRLASDRTFFADSVRMVGTTSVKCTAKKANIALFFDLKGTKVGEIIGHNKSSSAETLQYSCTIILGRIASHLGRHIGT